MRTDKFLVLVVTLWAATSTGMSDPERSDSHIQKIVNPINEFSMNLLKNVASHNGNFIISPLSISTLLAMLQQGAKQRSAAQLDSVLRLSSEDSRNGYQSLITSLQNRPSKTILKFGNGIFLNKNFDLSSNFSFVMDKSFRATVESVDFLQQRKAVEKVNRWVNEATNGKINGILNQGSISGRTELILANAIYFKGTWYNPFNPNKTVKAPFYNNRRSPPIPVDMMNLQQNLRAGEENNVIQAKWVELPYDDFEYSLILILPNDNIEALVQRMDASHLNYLANSDSFKNVKLSMPRFKLDTEASFVSVLQSLGVQDVFSQNSNLEGISETKTPLIVSDVLHKARIEVNELGSEAAAASAVLVNTLSLPPSYDGLEVTLDRPFLAIILDKGSKLPLFMAKVVDPSKT